MGMVSFPREQVYTGPESLTRELALREDQHLLRGRTPGPAAVQVPGQRQIRGVDTPLRAIWRVIVPMGLRVGRTVAVR